MVADVARPESLAKAVAEVAARHPRIDILVLSAGVSNAPGIATMDLEGTTR